MSIFLLKMCNTAVVINENYLNCTDKSMCIITQILCLINNYQKSFYSTENKTRTVKRSTQIDHELCGASAEDFNVQAHVVYSNAWNKVLQRVIVGLTTNSECAIDFAKNLGSTYIRAYINFANFLSSSSQSMN